VARPESGHYSPVAVAREYRPAGTFQLRYEDIAQDGRPLLHSIPPALGAVWRALLVDVADADVLKRQGILPILSRIRMDVTEHVVSPFRPFTVDGYGERLSGTAADYTRVLFTPVGGGRSCDVSR
jgi:hypothetical protein